MSADATLARTDSGFGSRNYTRPAYEPSARRLYLALLLAATIPVLLFSGGAMFLTARAARAAAREAAVRTVSHVAERVKEEIASEVEVAETLASLPSLDAPDLAAFQKQANRIVPARALWDDVLLFTPDGKQLMSVAHAFGERLGPAPDQSTFEQAARSRTAVIGKIGALPANEAERIFIGVPVVRDGELRFVVIVELSLREIRTILQNAGTPEGWTGLILDASGNPVASAGDGKGAMPTASRSPPGDGMQTGGDRFSVEKKLPDVGDWSVHYSIPAIELDRPVTRSLLLLAVGSLTSVVLAGGLANVASQELLQRRRAEEERAALRLLASEERCALVVEAADLGAWSLDASTEQVTGSRRLWRILALGRDAAGDGSVPLATVIGYVHPDDRASFERAIRDCLAGQPSFDIEFRVMGPDGQTGWLRAWGRASRRPGRETHIHGVMADILPRKRAQAERAQLLKRLVDAQERERHRIARELHDQVGQTVTAIALRLRGLEQLAATHRLRPEALQEALRSLRAMTGGIGEEIHRAAHDLSPAVLDELGLEHALTTLAAEWRVESGTAIDLHFANLERRLPADVEIAVYRVVQEALTNVMKHARAGVVSVLIERRASELRVIVEDDGEGFDSDESPSGRCGGLGLVGIRERLALLGGALRVESQLGAGTALFARVPLAFDESETSV